jgi:hypothetical protein
MEARPGAVPRVPLAHVLHKHHRIECFRQHECCSFHAVCSEALVVCETLLCGLRPTARSSSSHLPLFIKWRRGSATVVRVRVDNSLHLEIADISLASKCPTLLLLPSSVSQAERRRRCLVRMYAPPRPISTCREGVLSPRVIPTPDGGARGHV